MNDRPNKNPEVVEGRAYIIGREGHIYLNDDTVSKHHAEIKIENGKIFLRDLNSTNGTFLIKNRSLVRFEQGNLHPVQRRIAGIVPVDQPIAIGSKIYTPRQLLKAIKFFGAG